MPVTHGVPTITINHDHQFLVCDTNATMVPTAGVGFFARDTRFVSGYNLTINGRVPLLLDASPFDHFSARWEFTSPELPLAGTRNGAEHDVILEERALGIRLDRTIFEGIHEDYDLINYAAEPVRLILEVAIESDFADIFDVRRRRLVRRGDLQSSWHEKAGELRTTYVNESFKRDLVIMVERSGSHAEFANGRMQFVISLAPKETWHTCIGWLPVIDGHRARILPCSAVHRPRRPEMATGVLPPVDIETSHPNLPFIWRQAVADMEALRMADFAVRRSVFIPAAGIPWYVTLFGRDTLVVAMESISGFPEFAFGALDRLSRVQATDDNAEQDKEPGKIPHELRYGELATLGLLPFAPYFGTADATLLFLIVFSYAFQWSGDKEILNRYRSNAEAALKWMLEYGDRDRDGFQEYKTRSPLGFYCQGWKDSHDAIRHEDGSIAPLPHALCELQGYAFDALLRMSEAFQIWGDPERAEEMQQRATRLYEDFNERFWWEEEGTYYLGLDGNKQPIRSVASNVGHCLANGIVPPDRAERVVDRLMQPDMWSGWGVRTLSAEHPSYNPYSYHLGSVWPHDNATIAGGFRRAGRHTEAQQIAEGIFAAAERFEHYRLPELWAGVAREPGAYPVPYLGTNVPQAWSAAAVFRLIAILCGIHTAGQSRTIYINPDLPDWLPDLTLKNLRAGKGAAELRLKRDQVEVVTNTTGFEIVHGRIPRPPLKETPLART
ncbi:MAG: amylo-alpha-1,6-glucosidase [Chloroflexi bacterium]|nr:MAG: amylo-alpha-1,6-glucosidase [Chloroflexota bacterium]